MGEPRSVPRKISAGVILIDPHGRVLMQLRDEDPAIMFPGHWGLTGGAGKAGESPEETARREVLEETGLTLGKIEPFRAYYFTSAGKAVAGNGRRSARQPSLGYEVYVFHAPCPTPAEEMVCGEGRELRFFSPADVLSLDLAYNHRDVLTDFFASPAYALCRDGFGGGDEAPSRIDPLEHFLASLDAGTPWFDALMAAIALWECAYEVVDGRPYRYLISGEAFDWLLLAERLLQAAAGAIPTPEVERLIFEGRAPHESDSEDAAAMRLSDDRLRALIGDSKHRAHLNYLYGVTVEEALQYATELEVSKERRAGTIKDPRFDEEAVDPVYERIYGRPRAKLASEFRLQAGMARATHFSLSEFREFMYWLFKYRVSNQEPARVASDTRKALAHLAAMEAAVPRTGRTVKRQPAPLDSARAVAERPAYVASPSRSKRSGAAR